MRVCLCFIAVLGFVQFVQCQLDNPAVLPLLTKAIHEELSNLTSTILNSEIATRSRFCVKDAKSEWDGAFNFSSNLNFLTSCVLKTKGDIRQRVCTAAEAKFYFKDFFERNTNYLRPNKNCNLTSWVPGCEPGWACSVVPTQEVELANTRDIPDRTLDCQACCEGFFCPQGITCMIPCPLGSFCPLATLNSSTGVCDPYLYQLPPGQPNHTCGGANVWADVDRSSEVFCPAGSYCPTNTEKVPCSSGHYCRMGSTEQKRCFKLTSCGANTATQHIHAYGIMLIAAIGILLLIIYHFSDRILTFRERTRAKSREAASRSARQKVEAHEIWKSAKDAPNKHTNGLQDQQLSAASEIQKKQTSELMNAIHPIEEDLYCCEELHSEIGEKSVEKKMSKEKQMHSRTQIFNYAYAQLEREKALEEQNESLAFSGVVSMTTNTYPRKRPEIEISFRDLTLTLKGKNKHLLRCVTGKIMSGCITAVMGPSGAGKTTFLSALAGKAVGCTRTGLILINGRKESIHSYKRIIGFVPQDDIVHGNLTVEENLWFSARCRLSAELPKPDKVLIVERVIESLGLQPVRDSLVGTVEKRGISGGQRKRVNVGVELVMEPSLLFLDEPTSGLDSSSSQLLLRALRREALEGVNICMVVHQPSYTLFKMFNDLILLAKGGLVAYHGPVSNVEEYFEGLGINVPERINPPDYFIDILEGIIKPTKSLGVSYKELPLIWMLHNGYPVPSDMLQNSSGLALSTVDMNLGCKINPDCVDTKDQSFAGEVWKDLQCDVKGEHGIIRHCFLRSKDLSNRRTPGFLLQYKYFLGRVGKQRLREAKIQAIDYLILLLAGACLGLLTRMSDETFGAPGYMYTIIAVSLLCKIAALRSFSLDKLHYWRESGSGISSPAYFLSKDTIDHFNTVIKPVVYLSMFYFFSNLRSSFTDNYVVLFSLVYSVTGIAYVLAIFLEPGPSQLCSVILPVVFTLIANQSSNSKFLKNLADLCYTKWALQAFVTANAERYYGVWLITRCGSLMKSGYNIHDWGLCIVILILTGAASRLIAFLGIVTLQKK